MQSQNIIVRKGQERDLGAHRIKKNLSDEQHFHNESKISLLISNRRKHWAHRSQLTRKQWKRETCSENHTISKDPYNKDHGEMKRHARTWEEKRQLKQMTYSKWNCPNRLSPFIAYLWFPCSLHEFHPEDVCRHSLIWYALMFIELTHRTRSVHHCTFLQSCPCTLNELVLSMFYHGGRVSFKAHPSVQRFGIC